ncbi:valS [Symbiodinium pilosum]|uniref:ValS protein n=1 Tax=Symbiodinium pilosum TaxID=2952 RepID=A0A812VJV8_SYMPI|nr:valS [Symbiodinium pilosum]
MDVPISKGGLENAKAFANKIWNVGRFIITEHEKNAEIISTAWVPDDCFVNRVLVPKGQYPYQGPHILCIFLLYSWGFPFFGVPIAVLLNLFEKHRV